MLCDGRVLHLTHKECVRLYQLDSKLTCFGLLNDEHHRIYMLLLCGVIEIELPAGARQYTPQTFSSPHSLSRTHTFTRMSLSVSVPPLMNRLLYCF